MGSGFACAPHTIDPASLVTIGNLASSVGRPFWCFFELPFSKGSATKAPQEFRSPDYQARRLPGGVGRTITVTAVGAATRKQ